MAAIAVLSLLIQIVIATDNVPDINPRIHEGRDARIEDYPYFAGLINCGATILTDEWIITARHCVDYQNRFEYIEMLGRPIFVGGASFRQSYRTSSSRIVKHKTVDLALIKLGSSLQFSENIQPVRWPESENQEEKLIAIGRGITEVKEYINMADNLQELDVTRLPRTKCYRFSGERRALEGSLICVNRSDKLSNSDKQFSLCSGDSGSALLANDTLLGVAAFVTSYESEGHKACGENAYYENVLPEIPWIRKTIEKYGGTLP